MFISFVSCDPYDNRLTIINRTNLSLVISDRLWSKDTSIYNNKIAIDNFEFYEYQVLPYSSKKITTSGSWDRGFKNDTLVILIYNKEAILKKRVEKPSENYDIEQIIYVSRNYIKKNDWKINVNPKKTSKIVRL
ncbi:hypothetical protein [Flavobacterium nackdongense]|uniref:Uncharacterized protein n=1 Tax=Flavobacterium nackdongense TaxID=2547394 RepID=A0A4P6Y9Z8_9FLAO|nr:hypothetical protein [Flavobacterium nackdongense]QBN18908.1 hypothetical protein E1750_08855 [Flavobacterium nackdongense]